MSKVADVDMELSISRASSKHQYSKVPIVISEVEYDSDHEEVMNELDERGMEMPQTYR